MEYRTLGRTGFRVSALGLGGGGGSRLGQRKGCDANHSIRLVQQALDDGINFIDTAEEYGTEQIIGEALRPRQRDAVIVSTKKKLSSNGAFITPDELVAGLEQCLQRLGTDYVDIYHLHALSARRYEQARDRLVPTMQRMQRDGKIRAIGVTERFEADPAHDMLQQAVEDDCWDVMMVGFNILNQSPRHRVIEPARQNDVGILDMFAVRNDLRQPEKLRKTVDSLVERGDISPEALDRGDPLGFLTRPGVTDSLTDAAYRFCRDEPGVHVVLCGTGDPRHLRQNVAAIEGPPLPDPVRSQLMTLFAGVDTVSGQ